MWPLLAHSSHHVDPAQKYDNRGVIVDGTCVGEDHGVRWVPGVGGEFANQLTGVASEPMFIHLRGFACIEASGMAGGSENMELDRQLMWEPKYPM